MTNAEAIRRIRELQPELRANMAWLTRARAEHPELFPPNVPPLFADPKGEGRMSRPREWNTRYDVRALGWRGRDRQMLRAVRAATGKRRPDRSEMWLDLILALCVAGACVLLMWGATR